MTAKPQTQTDTDHRTTDTRTDTYTDTDSDTDRHRYIPTIRVALHLRYIPRPLIERHLHRMPPLPIHRPDPPLPYPLVTIQQRRDMAAGDDVNDTGASDAVEDVAYLK